MQKGHWQLMKRAAANKACCYVSSTFKQEKPLKLASLPLKLASSITQPTLRRLLGCALKWRLVSGCFREEFVRRPGTQLNMPCLLPPEFVFLLALCHYYSHNLIMRQAASAVSLSMCAPGGRGALWCLLTVPRIFSTNFLTLAK